MQFTIFGFGDKHRPWLNPQWTAYHLRLAGHGVTYFDPPLYKRLSVKKLLAYANAFRHPSVPVRDNLETSSLYRMLGLFGVSKLVDLSRDSKCIIFQPLWMHHLPASVVDRALFFIVDDYLAIDDSAAQRRATDYVKSLEAGRVAVTTRALQDQFPNARYLPNCIPDHVLTNDDVPAKEKDVIFAGTITDYKIDVDLLVGLIDRNAKLTFHIVGDVLSDCAASELSTRPNVILYGSLPHVECLDLMRRCRYALLPMKLGPYEKGMHSLKYFEYLASGCRIVATSLTMFNDVPKINTVVVNRPEALGDFDWDSVMPMPDVLKYLEPYTYSRRVQILESILGK